VSGTKREDIYITSKLMHNRTYDDALKDLKASLGRAGLEYFDLYLLHSPIGGPAVRKELWRALVDAKKAGLAKSIGVSNFGAKHIQEMVDAGVELPVVNQIDLHPFMRHPDIVEICEKHGILLEVSFVSEGHIESSDGPTGHQGCWWPFPPSGKEIWTRNTCSWDLLQHKPRLRLSKDEGYYDYEVEPIFSELEGRRFCSFPLPLGLFNPCGG